MLGASVPHVLGWISHAFRMSRMVVIPTGTSFRFILAIPEVRISNGTGQETTSKPILNIIKAIN